MVLLAATSWSLTSSDSSFDTCFPCFDSSGGRRHLWEGLLQVVPKVVRTLETSCNLLKHRTPINRAKLADMKDKKVPNLLTTDSRRVSGIARLNSRIRSQFLRSKEDLADPHEVSLAAKLRFSCG